MTSLVYERRNIYCRGMSLIRSRACLFLDRSPFDRFQNQHQAKALRLIVLWELTDWRITWKLANHVVVSRRFMSSLLIRCLPTVAHVILFAALRHFYGTNADKHILRFFFFFQLRNELKWARNNQEPLLIRVTVTSTSVKNAGKCNTVLSDPILSSEIVEQASRWQRTKNFDSS